MFIVESIMNQLFGAHSNMTNKQELCMVFNMVYPRHAMTHSIIGLDLRSDHRRHNILPLYVKEAANGCDFVMNTAHFACEN